MNLPLDFKLIITTKLTPGQQGELQVPKRNGTSGKNHILLLLSISDYIFSLLLIKQSLVSTYLCSRIHFTLTKRNCRLTILHTVTVLAHMFRYLCVEVQYMQIFKCGDTWLGEHLFFFFFSWIYKHSLKTRMEGGLKPTNFKYKWRDINTLSVEQHVCYHQKSLFNTSETVRVSHFCLYETSIVCFTS